MVTVDPLKAYLAYKSAYSRPNVSTAPKPQPPKPQPRVLATSKSVTTKQTQTSKSEVPTTITQTTVTQQSTARDEAFRIAREAREQGATRIEIYNMENQPIGAINIKGAEDPLEYLAKTGDFGYRFSVPKPVGEFAQRKQSQAEFKTFISRYQKKDATFEILDKSGLVVATTSKEHPRFDILKAEKQYGEVSVRPIVPTRTFITGREIPKPAPDTIQEAGLYAVAPFYNLGVSLAMLPKGVEQTLAGVSAEERQEELQQYLIRDPAQELITTGSFSQPTSSTAFKASLLGNVALFLPALVVGGGKLPTTGIAKPILIKPTILSRLSPSQTKILQLAKGTREGEQLYGVSKIKGTKTYEFEQGRATEETQIPLAMFEVKGGTAFVRSEPFEKIAPNKAMIKGMEAGLAKKLGFRQVYGTKDTFIGQITAQNKPFLEGAVKQGAIKPITDIYQFPTRDVLKEPSLYSFVTRNPKQIFKYPDLVKPDIIRYYEGQNVGLARPTTRIPNFETGSMGLNRLLSTLGQGRTKFINPQTGKLEEIRYNFTPAEQVSKSLKKYKPFDFKYLKYEKGVAGGAGKSKALSLEKIGEIKQLIRVSSIVPKIKVRSDYLGLTAGGRYVRRGEQEEERFIVYPPSTEISLKSILRQNISKGERIKVNTVLRDIQSQRTKLSTLLNTRALQLTRTKLITEPDLRVKFTPSYVIGHKQSQKTGLIEIQKTIQTTRLITIPKIPPRPPVELLVGGFAIPYFSFGGTGGGKRKGGRREKSYFIYSVNPNVVGVIEQAGLPSKVVSAGIGKIKAFDVKIKSMF